MSLINPRLGLYKGTIDGECRVYNIPPVLVYAMIHVESAYLPYAWNPEPHYRWFWDVKNNAPFRPVAINEVSNKYPPKDFPCLAGDPDQEWWAQQASWGLMQIMGAVAREMGYEGEYLPAICFPSINISLGVAFLSRLLRRLNNTHGLKGAISTYNTGNPHNITGDYVNKVGKAVLIYNEGKPIW